MRAIVAEQPGPPDVLRPADLPDPVPGAGSVTIDVEVASITFIETQMRAGSSPKAMAPFPIVLGGGVGGVVSLLGDGVDASWLGHTVVATTGGSGGYATKALASAADLHVLPEGLELQTAVALISDGRTAIGLADAARIREGDVVVVTSAGGGMGSLLVQLARRAGAHVVALAGNAAKRDLALRLGAHATVGYRAADWASDLDAAAPDGFDVVFDGVGGETSAVLSARLRRGARYVMHGASSGRFGGVDERTIAEQEIVVVSMMTIANTPEVSFDLVERAFALAAANELQPTVGQWFPLDRAADAHAAIESRTTIGKTLLIV